MESTISELKRQRTVTDLVSQTLSDVCAATERSVTKAVRQTEQLVPPDAPLMQRQLADALLMIYLHCSIKIFEETSNRLLSLADELAYGKEGSKAVLDSGS